MARCPDVGVRPPDWGGSHRDWLLAQIRAHLYLGQLAPGDRLPSVRDLARRLRVSPTTALDLYRSLESEGLVQGRERSGVFLTAGAHAQETEERDRSAFLLVTHVVKKAGLYGVAPGEIARMLLRYAGAQRRHDFTVAAIGHGESLELMERQLARRLGFALPLLHIPQKRTASELRAVLERDESVGCVLTTLLNFHLVRGVAEELGLPLVAMRLAPAAAALFEMPRAGRRYVVVRDREMASYLRRTACHLARIRGHLAPCPSGADDMACRQCETVHTRQAPGVSFAALDEEEFLADFDTADVVHATVTALDGVRRRYGHSKRIVPIAAHMSDDTVEELLFQYVCGRPRGIRSRPAVAPALPRTPLAARASG